MRKDKGSDFFRIYDLVSSRRANIKKTPAGHQQQALVKLGKWFRQQPEGPSGGILVLPTGGGKTFTASHFLCRQPISEGYKVLWLAHTHHLLEQAHYGFEDLVGLVAEPKKKLGVRVVSGTVGHFKVADIKPSDDVVVSSIQTAWNALKNNHPAMDSFIDAAEGRVMLVVDEAHHSPAPSYRLLIEELASRVENLKLLGLTATPTYSDSRRVGWLAKLFPQGIISQARMDDLMAAGILAQPIIENHRTDIKADIDEREFFKWANSNRDIPEDIVTYLAQSQARNDFIVSTYVENRKRYGKTIIFADRWLQCEYLREALEKRGVRADAVYQHIDANPDSASARNRRTSEENAKVIRKFRNNKLDVLINVRMLTEGTDVPNVQSVFLTRQTTSQILLTQMVGRSLRGPKFGGTKEAYIVSFIDNWEHNINWAEYCQLVDGEREEDKAEYGRRPPLEYLSIELVRRLARQMDSGQNVAPAPFTQMLPVGWYRVDFHVLLADTEESEPRTRLVMVFDGHQEAFNQCLKSLGKTNLDIFDTEDCTLAGETLRKVSRLKERFFGEDPTPFGGNLINDIFDLARHVAQGHGSLPRFFSFMEREKHDLDALALGMIDKPLSIRDRDLSLRTEFERTDLFWRVIYPNFSLFRSQYEACQARILDKENGTGGEIGTFTNPETPLEREPNDEIKKAIKKRDRYQCLCCCYDLSKRYLEIDHIAPFYLGGTNDPANLQTLCRKCNSFKGANQLNFRNQSTTLNVAPNFLPLTPLPEKSQIKDRRYWEFFIYREFNCFYQCAAVNSVYIRIRGENKKLWEVGLNPGNDSRWITPLLPALVNRINATGGLGDNLKELVLNK